MKRGDWFPRGPRDYSLSRFRKFCGRLGLKIHPFQAQMLKDHFDGVTELVIIIPKKNGKTTLLGALALFHLACFPDTAEVLIVASSRDQARILFKQAASLVAQADLGSVFVVKAGYGFIWLAGGNSAGPKIAVRPAEAGTGDGVIPTLALVDELHRHRSLDLYGVLRDGLLGNSRMVTISTAGAGEQNPLWTVRSRARGLQPFRARAAHSHFRSEDGAFAMHEWSLSDTDDLDDLKVVKRANPAPWITLESLAFRKNSPSMTPERWARFACGIWTYGSHPLFTAAQWDPLAVDIGGVQMDDDVTVHVCAGRESAAVVLVAPRPDDQVAVHARIVKGDDVPLSQVERMVMDVFDSFRVIECSYDRVEFQRPAELLESRGVPMIERPHSPEGLSIASLTLLGLVQSGALHHDGDPELRSSVLQGTTKETTKGWHIVKTPQSRALVALAFAAHAATQVPTPAPEYVAL
jgi:phage terminase large subunit-like protein